MNALWPYGLGGALLAIPVVWLLVALILGVTAKLAAWPPPPARLSVLWITLAVSLAPLVLHLIDLARARWGGGPRPGAQSHALTEIQLNRANYEDMASRTFGPQPVDVAGVIARFQDLAREAAATTDETRLTGMIRESEMLAERRAFLCPKENIASEAKSHLFTLADRGLSTQTLDALKEAAAPALDVKDDVGASRGALHVIFEEYDRWDTFIQKYNANMSFWTGAFLVVIGFATTAALVMTLGWSWRILAVVLAAIAGATASVMARLPRLTSYGEWRVNLRAWQARIGTGIVGSLVGIGLLGSGVITIALPAPWKSADLLLNACLTTACPTSSAPGTATSAPPAPGSSAETASVSPPAECTAGALFFVLALTMLLGFSERLLTSLEGRVVPAAPAVSAAPAATNQPRAPAPSA